jgi:hypothetical protein
LTQKDAKFIMFVSGYRHVPQMIEIPEEEYVAKECPHCYTIPQTDGEPDPYLGWLYCKRLGDYVRDISECRIRTAFRYEDKYLTSDIPD